MLSNFLGSLSFCGVVDLKGISLDNMDMKLIKRGIEIYQGNDTGSEQMEYSINFINILKIIILKDWTDVLLLVSLLLWLVFGTRLKIYSMIGQEKELKF